MTGTQNEGAMDNARIARNLECVEKHFHSEAVDEVEAALDLYTDDIIWDAPALNGLDRSFSASPLVRIAPPSLANIDPPHGLVGPGQLRKTFAQIRTLWGMPP